MSSGILYRFLRRHLSRSSQPDRSPSSPTRRRAIVAPLSLVSTVTNVSLAPQDEQRGKAWRNLSGNEAAANVQFFRSARGLGDSARGGCREIHHSGNVLLGSRTWGECFFTWEPIGGYLGVLRFKVRAHVAASVAVGAVSVSD